VRDLEDRYASGAGHDTAGLAWQERQITEVSLRYGVLCRFTAFVAVDSRVVTDGAGPHRVTQPVELPAGWDPAGAGPPPGVGWTAAAVAASAPGPAMPMYARSGRGRASSKRASKAGTWAATSPRPLVATAAGCTAEAPRLPRARRQAADEAAALRAARGAPDAERARLLADLATRIEALLAALGAAREAGTGGELAGLAELARELHACDEPGRPGRARLEALWQEAIRVLTGFAGDAGPGGDSRAFWKRS
jgi:Ca-activated chloride channel family protein